MRKKVLFILPLLSALILPSKIQILNAANEIEETASYQDMVVRTAMNQGGLYTDFELVDYNIIHGSVVDNNLVQFTEEQCVKETGWAASLGTSTDNAYCNHWKLNSFNNDGIIAQVIAKQEVYVDISRTSLGGWPDDASLGLYKVSNDVTTTINQFIATASTPLTSYNFSNIKLNKGEILYYEFKTPSTVDNYRNLQQLPNFTFRSTSSGEESGGEIVTPPAEITPDDFSNQNTINLANLTKEIVALNGEAVTLKDMNINLLQGKINGTIEGFNNYSYTNNVALITNGTTFDGKASASFASHRIKTTSKSSALFKIEATNNIKLSITHPSCNEGWIDEHGQYFALHVYTADRYFTQWSKPITSKEVVENQFGGEIMLKQGDIAFFEFGSNIADERNVNIAPVFTSNLEEYDETIRNNQCQILSASLKDVAKHMVSTQGEPFVAEDMEIELLQGNVFTGTRKYKRYDTLEGSDGYTYLLSDSGSFDGQEGAAISSWRMKTTNTSSAIIKVKAKNDTKLSITHDAFSGGWIDEYGQYFAVYYKSNDVIYTIWTKSITTNMAEENTFAADVMLKQNDEAYFVFGSNEALERNVNIVPKFATSKENYNEEARLEQCSKIADEKINMWDALTAVLNNNFNDVSFNMVQYGFYIGKVKEEEKCEVAVGDGTGTANDALWDSDLTAGFLRWQIQCDVDEDAIIKITSKENVNIKVSHTAIWSDAWSTFTSVRYYVMDLDGTLSNYKEIPVALNTKDNYFAIDVNLKKGQVLYIDYYTRDDQYGSLNFAPTITVSSQNFDESKLIDFDFVRELNKVKENAISEIEDMLYEIDEFSYSYANYEKIKDIFADAITNINMANSEDEIISIKNSIQPDIDKIITYAQLKTYKDEQLSLFEEYVSSINQKDYTKENYKKIQNKVEEAKEAISKGATMTEVDNIIINTKKYIDTIEKKEKGCNGSINYSLFAVALFTMLMMKKRKNSN